MKRGAIAATLLGSWLMLLAVPGWTERQADVRLSPLASLQGSQVAPMMLTLHP
jgi:hypothetical protein